MELIKYAQQLSRKIATEKSAEGLSLVDQRLRASYANKRGIVEIADVIWKNFGFRGFFIGFKYHVGRFIPYQILPQHHADHHLSVRDIFGGAAYFGTYEYMKHSLGPQQGRDAAHGASVFAAGTLCGAFSSAIVSLLHQSHASR
jgi:hypothetical protein